MNKTISTLKLIMVYAVTKHLKYCTPFLFISHKNPIRKSLIQYIHFIEESQVTVQGPTVRIDTAAAKACRSCALPVGTKSILAVEGAHPGSGNKRVNYPKRT